MNVHVAKYAISLLVATVIIAGPGLVGAVDPDWKAVEQALGKSGQLQTGDVFRIGMPRTDLTVTVKGVPVKAPFALGSYAAFKQIGSQAMVMGDLVLLDQEVPPVMSGLFAGMIRIKNTLGQSVACWLFWLSALYVSMVLLRRLGLYCYRNAVVLDWLPERSRPAP